MLAQSPINKNLTKLNVLQNISYDAISCINFKYIYDIYYFVF